MPDAPKPLESIFSDARPTAIMDERDARSLMDPAAQTLCALSHQSILPLKLGHKFEDQFVAKYIPRIFPWTLRFMAGGPEYPDLFSDNCSTRKLRRIETAAAVTPLIYTKNMARRTYYLYFH